ncbi:MAG: ABC transporter permease subunit [Gammaproteobacteria bacterium]|jgi:putrescine transport system permease protein
MRTRRPARRRPLLLFTLASFGFAFLYVPILALVAYSFNASDRVMVWTGISTRWYAALLEDSAILRAAGLTLQVAAVNACGATLLGLAAGYVLARFGRFRTRSLFAGLLAAPLVVPEVVTGLSLLVLFVALGQTVGWPAERGFTTITIAHITFSTAYVAVIVQARLAQLDTSLEEAALDLGATPTGAFFRVTVPLLAPALVAGWLLAFTLSIDDLVIASFVAGPGASTLPMLIFSKVRLGLSPEINALATLMMVTVMALGVLALLLLGRRGRSDLS